MVYFVELSTGIRELDGFRDMSILQCQRAWRENWYSLGVWGASERGVVSQGAEGKRGGGQRDDS